MLLTPFSVFGAVLHYRLQLDKRSVVTLICRILGAAAVLMLVLWEAPLSSFIVVGVLFGVPGVLIGFPEAVLLYLYYRKSGHFRLAVDRKTCLGLLSESLPLAVCALLIMTYARVDQLMLQGMLGEEELVGTYGLAVRYAEILRIIPLAFVASVFPSLCRIYQNRRESFAEAYTRSFKYMNMICIPAACASVVLAGPFIAKVNPAYKDAASILSLLLFAEVFVFLGIVNNRLLISSDRQSLDYVFTGTSAVVNVLLNLLLIPRLGMTGAAVASMAAYGTGPVIGLFIPYTRQFSMQMFRQGVRPLLASAVMLVALFYSLPVLGIVTCIPVGIAVYGVVFVLLKGVDARDMELVKKLLAKDRALDA